MWRPGDDERDRVTCPGCGTTLPRSDAREYDKYGDRWDREDKRFEYFCKPCHDRLCLQNRDELEDLLCDIEMAGAADRDEFLAAYSRAVEERYGTPGDPG